MEQAMLLRQCNHNRLSPHIIHNNNLNHNSNIPIIKEEDLTTKNGRVTFKDSIKESKYHNPFVTRKLMGWGKSKSIEDIYDRFTIKDFIEVKEYFDVYLKSVLNN